MAGILGSAIGAIAQVGTSIYNTERNRSMANAQRDWEEHMWRLNNEYNTPSAQRQRLVDAGLNPALMYETMPQNTASPAGGGASAHADARFDPSSLLISAQLENMKAQTENTKADAERKWFDLEREKVNAPMRTEGISLDNTAKGTANAIAEIERKYREESLILSNAGLNLRNQQTQKFITQMDPRFKNEMQKMVTEIANIRSQTAVNKGQLTVQESNVDLNAIRQVIEKYEADARRAGWSYSDNILFRQFIAPIMEAANKGYDRTGKGSESNTTIVKALVTVLTQLLQ